MCDPKEFPVEGDISTFLQGLENCVAAGEKFKAGETFQVGWMLTMIEANREGSLSIFEPDFQVMPIRWRDSVALTLLHLRLQRDACQSVVSFDEIDFPSIRQSATICTHFCPSEGFAMGRGKPIDPNDTGWFCSCLNKRHNHNSARELHRLSLYELVVRYGSQIVPYAALPEGVAVIVNKGVPTIFRQGQ